MPSIEIPDFILENLNKLKHKDEPYSAVIGALVIGEINRRGLSD